MKNHGRSFTGLCAVLLAVLVLVPLNAADLNGDTYLLTTIDKLRIRTSPKLDGQVIRTMEKGEKLVLLGVGKTAAIDGMSGPWLKVLTESYGTYGWVYGPYVKQSDEAIPYGDNIPFTDNVSPIFFGLGSNNDQFNVWQDKLQIPAMAARKAEILTVHEGRRLIAQHSLEPGKLVTSAEILLDLGAMKAGTHVLEFSSWRGGGKIAGRELVLEVFKRTSKTITKGDSPDFSYAVKAMNCTLRSLFRTVPGEEGPYPVPDFNRYLLELPLDYRMEIQLKEDPNITDIYQLPLELKLYRQNLIVTRQLMKLWDLSGGADMVFAEQGS